MTEKQAMQKLKSDILLRGHSASTLKGYTRGVKGFLAFCERPVEELNEIDVRRFLSYLIAKKQYAPRTVNNHSAAIRFFFAVTPNRTMNYLQIPLMRVPKDLPEVLTKEEVKALLDACENLKHKVLLLLAYGSGLRSSEIASLRVLDIDSKEMRIFVKGGKTKRDHYTVLPQTTLAALRKYWLRYRPNSPESWLFPGSKNVGHITRAAVALAFSTAMSKTSVTKEVSPHTLRHSFATHMLEDGVDIIKIKELLGHHRLQSTTRYLRIANAAKGITSPADTLNGQTEEPSDG